MGALSVGMDAAHLMRQSESASDDSAQVNDGIKYISLSSLGPLELLKKIQMHKRV